ncbi:hypothetical protein BS17DRAFT_765634 [Gyrodon lividus]|nr:hypothetical protein BS17DRAFT_765634 [Gyrodon lividus]
MTGPFSLGHAARSRSGISHDLISITGVVYGLDDSELDYVIADADDDDDVPLSAVIHDALGVAQVPAKVDGVPLCVRSMEKGPGNLLVAAGEYEDIWAFINFDLSPSTCDTQTSSG